MSEIGVGERPSEQRIREAQALGEIDYFVVSCPKDLTMYSAAAQTVGDVRFEVVELTALVERALDRAEAQSPATAIDRWTGAGRTSARISSRRASRGVVLPTPSRTRRRAR